MAAKAAAQLPPLRRSAAARSRLRIGYFSSTHRAHASGYLLRRVLGAHDRDRVRLAAYVYGETPRSNQAEAFTRGLRAEFETVIDLTALSDAAAAAAIRADTPDVVLDIDGYANGGRPGILAARVAPLQIAWLGFLGTMGAPFIDAILADVHTIPTELEPCFDERVLRLPSGFFPGDGARPVSNRFRSRGNLGLPDHGVVFCAFNQPMKINPTMLDAWAAILRRTPGSVLWLWDVNPLATRNLTAELAARGLGPPRIVFAPSLPSPDHLCRYASRTSSWTPGPTTVTR